MNRRASIDGLAAFGNRLREFGRIAGHFRNYTLFFITITLEGTANAQQNILYTPIPSGFDFPADQQTLLKLLDAGDVAGMRTHAWMVFAGLTQPAIAADPNSEPIWETWYPGNDVFAPPSTGPALQGFHPRTFKPVFSIPRQFLPIPGEPNLQAAGAALASFTLFNQATMDHVRKNRYQMRSTLQALNDSWSAQTPPAQRTVMPFPKDAMSLKLVWWVIKANGVTAMPIWDPKPPVANAPAQPPTKWNRVVVVDPNRTQIPAGETRDATLFGKKFRNSHVVPLEVFYHFRVTPDEAQQLQQIANGIPSADPNVQNAQAGDYLALVAMHYTTKEIPNWVWATFWWHDKPDDGPFARNRPDATRLKGPWRNYLMDVAMDMTKPLEANGSAHVTFNPWLEARFGNGTNSNCMACHQLAVWDNQNFLPVVRGPVSLADPRFTFPDGNGNTVTLDHGTSVDFLWSLLKEGDQPHP